MRLVVPLAMLLAIGGALGARADDLDDRYQACMGSDAHEPASLKPRPMKWRPGFEHCEADVGQWHDRDNEARADHDKDAPEVKVDRLRRSLQSGKPIVVQPSGGPHQ